MSTFRNGGYKHVIRLASHLSPSHFLNILTGYPLRNTEKFSSDYQTFKVFSDGPHRIAYMNRMVGAEFADEIDRILQLYGKWISVYLELSDEALVKELVETELRHAEENAALSKKIRRRRKHGDSEVEETGSLSFERRGKVYKLSFARGGSPQRSSSGDSEEDELDSFIVHDSQVRCCFCPVNPKIGVRARGRAGG